MKENEPAYPIEVRLFGADAVVTNTQEIAHLFE
jgi:hypothetical protein